MESILAFLDRIEDVLEESRGIPFSNRVSVDKESIYEIIDEIRLNIPNEIRQAQKIVKDCEKITSDAKAKAQAILRDAQSQADILLSEHEISRKAHEHARILVEDSRKETLDMHLNARDHVDEILERVELIVDDTLNNISRQNNLIESYLSDVSDSINQNRKELRNLQKNDKK